MKKLALAFLALGIGCLAAAQEVTVNLLVPTGGVAPGKPVAVSVVLLNATGAEARVEMPATLAARLEGGGRVWPVELRAPAGATPVIAPGAFALPAYALDLPPDARGRVVLEIRRPALARAVIEVEPAAPAPARTVPGAGPVAPAPAPGAEPATAPAAEAEAPVTAASIQRTFTGYFSTHQPMYFLMGAKEPAAKFQFSFKYRLLGDEREPGPATAPLRGLYFGYTQRSLWDVTAASSPFLDTSYMPELMFESLARDQRSAGPVSFHWLGFQAAVQHESNGKSDPDSRSLNLLYVRPMLAFGRRDGWWLVFAPKIFAYVGGLSDNPDLARYRGYGEYSLILTKNDSLAVTLTGRIGDRGDRGSLQVDVTYPLRMKFGDFATFVMVQYFDGYGESLLDYQKKSSALRVGVALVR